MFSLVFKNHHSFLKPKASVGAQGLKHFILAFISALLHQKCSFFLNAFKPNCKFSLWVLIFFAISVYLVLLLFSKSISSLTNIEKLSSGSELDIFQAYLDFELQQMSISRPVEVEKSCTASLIYLINVGFKITVLGGHLLSN